MDYKDTLSLPWSNFPMRGNLPANEPIRYAKWKENGAYEKMLNKRLHAKKSFYLHDGPPYANGHLHIGHALNKILKDIIIKLHYFKGEKVLYTPGWDCHGLPIEQQVEKSLKKDKKDFSIQEIRSLCREHAGKFVQIQSQEFESLGVLGDFKNPYKTMDFAFEAGIYRVLIELVKRGILAQRNKPIYWSWACQTALADAEVEYQEKRSTSVMVGFDLHKDCLKALNLSRARVVIWTTTPWTLPANVGIALNPEAEYVCTKNGFVVAHKLLERLWKIGVVDCQIERVFLAKELAGHFAINPINGRKSSLILGDHVSLEEGSGAVHTAPGHGEEDYYLGLKYGLEVLMPVDDRGCYNEEILNKKLLPPSFLGKHIFKAEGEILELLGDSLLKKEEIFHSYPHCWRSHEPVIYRATTQWFILMDEVMSSGPAKGKTLREVALRELENVEFYPQAGRNRIQAMIEDRPDWCISRQRDWGVPIAFFYDRKNGCYILDEEVLEFLANRFEREGCDIWWSQRVEDLLPSSYAHRAKDFEKSLHILDVWFESGSTWSVVLDNGERKTSYRAGEFPAHMYLEGSDQHRGWFQSSLLLSCALLGRAPYKSVLTHGFTVDERGEKMSKSKGNVIAPETVLKNQGSEILRLWVAMNDYHTDLKISNPILNQISDQYKKLRNTLRFLLANVEGLDALCDGRELGEIDIWMLGVSERVFSSIRECMDRYDFVRGMHILMHYVANELSGIYMDLCKDSLYCDRPLDRRVRAHKSVMFYIAKNLMHLLAPILTYTIDEALEHAPKIFKKFEDNLIEDVFDLLGVDSSVFGTRRNGDFSSLLEIRARFGEVVDRLKKDRKIKSSLELVLDTADGFRELDEWLIVSKVVDSSTDIGAKDFLGEELASFFCNRKYTLYRCALYKCPRCWRYLSQELEQLCSRCQEVLR